MAVRQFVSQRIAGLAFALVAMAAASAPALAEDDVITVLLDRAVVVRVARPADTVIVGNPMIADATVRDNRTLILTGRSFGTTNLIVLDKDGEPIATHLVTVGAAEDNLVTVYTRPGRQTYSCTPVCEPVIAVGDDSTTYSDRTTQVKGRQDLVPDDGG
jgi:Flp pilus assembly secretin CpaC